MLILYVKTGCPYCGKVKAFIDDAGIGEKITERNVADDGVVDELVAHGGQAQVPYLIDEERGESMYESDVVIEYLKTHYA